MENGEWKMESGKWKVENGKWKVESGKWKVESGKWKVESGKWKVESGKFGDVIYRNMNKRFSKSLPGILLLFVALLIYWFTAADKQPVINDSP